MGTIRRAAALLLTCLLLAGLTACASTPLTREEQFSALVRGNLDEIYRGRANSDYLKLTGSTKEDVEASFERGLNQEVVFFCGYFSISNPSDRITGEIKDLYRDIYASSSYTVSKAVRVDDSTYTVNVVIQPLDVIQAAIDNHDSALAGFFRKYDGIDRKDLHGDELAAYEEDWAEAIIAMVRGQLTHITYRDTVTVTVRVEKTEDGSWQMNADDLQEIDRLILYYPANNG